MASRNPPILRTLPEPRLRMIRDRLVLDSYLRTKPVGVQCNKLVGTVFDATGEFLGHKPPISTVRDAVAGVIVQRQDFLDFVRDAGVPNPSDEELAEVARATAGVALARYLEEQPDVV